METDLLGVGFDFYWPPPPHLLLEDDFYSMCVLPASDAADSMSGLYNYREDSNSPDGANSCSVAVPTMSSSPPPQQQQPGGGGAASKNMVTERDRRRRLNEKLYALRSVVPNITKMDKASIVRDAIAYIEKLQEEERRMLAEISALESSSVKTEVADSFRCRKRPWTAPDDDGATRAPPSPPVKILDVQVSEAAEKVAVVSVRSSRGRDAVAKVCRALEPLRLRVVTATVAAVGDTVGHTMFVQSSFADYRRNGWCSTEGDSTSSSRPTRCDGKVTEAHKVLGLLNYCFLVPNNLHISQTKSVNTVMHTPVWS